MPTNAVRPDVPGLCLACGLDLAGQGELPWGAGGDSPTFNFCPCCGVEFGYGDFTIEAAKRWRQTWLAAGCPGSEPSERPDGWDAAQQLASLPKRVR